MEASDIAACQTIWALGTVGVCPISVNTVVSGLTVMVSWWAANWHLAAFLHGVSRKGQEYAKNTEQKGCPQAYCIGHYTLPRLVKIHELTHMDDDVD